MLILTSLRGKLSEYIMLQTIVTHTTSATPTPITVTSMLLCGGYGDRLMQQRTVMIGL